MANYNLVVDTSSFKPMDFNMGMQVMNMGREAYKDLTDKLEKIAEENGDYDIPEGTMAGDIDISKQLSDLKQQRDNIAASIATEFNAGNRAAAEKFFIDYKSKMKPIKDMITAYNDEVSKISQVQMNDPSTIMLYTPKLGDYYGGIKKSRVMLVSGNSIAKDIAASLGAALASKAQELHISETKIEGILKTWQDSGLSAEQIYNIAADPKYSNTLTKEQKEIGLLIGKVMEDVKQAYGYYNISDPTQQRKFDSYLRIGAVAATPKAEVNTISDPRPGLELQRSSNNLAWAQFNYQKWKDAIEREGALAPETNGEETLYVALYSTANNNLYASTGDEKRPKYTSTTKKYEFTGKDNPTLKSIAANHIKVPKVTVNGLSGPNAPKAEHYDQGSGDVTYTNGLIYNLRSKKWRKDPAQQSEQTGGTSPTQPTSPPPTNDKPNEKGASGGEKPQGSSNNNGGNQRKNGSHSARKRGENNSGNGGFSPPQE